MREDGNVFTCYSNMWDTIFYSELGSSLAVLKGGYNLDSFMVRYQGVDWTDQASWECNGRRVSLRHAATRCLEAPARSWPSSATTLVCRCISGVFLF